MDSLTPPNSKPKDLSAPLIWALAATFLIASTSLAQARTQAELIAPIEPSLPYIVKPADKLIQLSRELLISTQAWNAVARYNQLKNPNLIFPGQRLDIPLRYLKSKPAAGKLISAEGDVALGGSATQPGAAIGDGSQLKTGANSSAVIELGDGSRIKILPDSLAEVVSNRNYAMRDASASGSTNWFSGLLRLSAGTLEALASKTAKRATPLQIETPTSLVGVRGTEFRIGYDDPINKSARTEVIEGKVRADNPAQQSGADLPAGTGALIKPLEKEVRIVALLPAPDLRNMAAEVLKPLGSWAMPALDGALAYRVQLSSDEKFDRIVRDLKVTTGSADLASLANGNWFARVRGIDALGLEGFDSVKLIVIKDGQWRVSYSSISLVNGKTVLSWIGHQPNGQAMATANSYSALVARDQALTQTVVTAEAAASTQRLDLGDLKPGSYFIRLRSNNEMSSEIYRLEIPGNWGQSVFDQTSSLQPVK